MSIKQEQKQKPEEVWRGIFEETKIALRKNEAVKAGIIQKCCAELETRGMPVSMICGRVIRELADFASRRYLYDVIEEKYKDSMKIREYHKKEPEESAIPSAPKHDKKNIEQDSEVEEDTEIYEINVEDYRIEDVEKYDKKFLQELVIYLHNKLQKLQTGRRK